MDLKSLPVEAVIALLCGLLILVQPSLLSDVVAIYLIIVGLTGLGTRYWR